MQSWQFVNPCKWKHLDERSLPFLLYNQSACVELILTSSLYNTQEFTTLLSHHISDTFSTKKNKKKL